MTMGKVKSKHVLMTAVLALSIFTIAVYAVSSVATSISYVKPNNQAKYIAGDAVKIRVSGQVIGQGSLPWVGIEWGKKGFTDPEKWLWPDNQCEQQTKCVKEFTLPGKASDYTGYEFAPIYSGVLDGRSTGVLAGQAYPIVIVGVALTTVTGPANIKPTVTITPGKPEIFKGDKVKFTVQASDGDSNLKSITVKIPSINKEETNPCGHKELRSCKYEFTASLPDAGTVTVEAVAEDLVGGDTGTSEKATTTITVNNRVSVTKGMNVIKVESALVGKPISDFGGMLDCRYSALNMAKIKKNFEWKWTWAGANVESDDALIIMYCPITAQESYYDTTFDEFD